MGTFSIWHWLVVLAIVVVLFGGSGKISRLMGDFAKGINAFKKGLEEGKSVPSADTQDVTSSDSRQIQKTEGESASQAGHVNREKNHSTGM
ncbi:twin-arginine translocase TatA/TatE family subunit [Haematospirillum sp. H1815]|uniref:twin-arginine translocase TatA/TatE family subunit n=1 Tax=Haematospirillum sp. H1815 TaxID=2723108 RepID=UPI00143A9E60|nr:twin-arginine translocase TatA/TatE family subunit [Haematospirillum sp. H1815]NKD76487.1 twin-arginine translocase TatA/TatE family subunit [Haematospirillum sp. H1815]